MLLGNSVSLSSFLNLTGQTNHSNSKCEQHNIANLRKLLVNKRGIYFSYLDKAEQQKK